jgi:hypothetical protein
MSLPRGCDEHSCVSAMDGRHAEGVEAMSSAGRSPTIT